MKTTFVKSAALVILLLVGAMNTNLFAGEKYVVNYETEGDRVTSKIVYINDGTLRQHMRYNYKYNDEGKVIEKETLKWNNKKSEWSPYYRHTYSYMAEGYVIEYAAWNPKTKAYVD